MRYLFGGTTDTAAETATGARLPNAVGTVWGSGTTDAVQLTDLVDINGNPMSLITADKTGMLPAFYGPDGYRYLWVDFGAGRYMVVPTDTVTRLDEHLQGIDPHGDRSYTNSVFDRALPKAGGTVEAPEQRNWLTVRVPGNGAPGDGEGTVYQLTDGTTPYTRLFNNGALHVDTMGAPTSLALGSTATGNFITAHNGRSAPSPAGSVFTVTSDGSVIAAGTVTGRNIGTARVFSGPTPPPNPQVGDVWVKFG
ncbi:hypothetical protein ACFWXK_15520 [Streptomyces sp. NPDC059070]|uniref:hypothetical protein n=1 Tax=Streptomyces sp. NPDC059070 TaxID=3346713 RepID=UPI00367D6A66